MASTKLKIFLPILVMISAFMAAEASVGAISRNVDITWGNGRGKFLSNGQLSLSLDNSSGAGFQSKKQFLFGKFDMQIKLVPNNSAGTVVAYYLRSQELLWDEIDFEFLGNISGQPYVLHTNIFTHGKGNREQQFYLWFDPTVAFHTYSVLWNPSNIIIYVDNTPIRVFKNLESAGVPYLKSQPMRIYGSLWNADDWATRGGLVKTNWTLAPFRASFRSLNYDACIVTNGVSSCKPKASKRFLTQKLDILGQNRIKAVQSKYMIYNYCVDTKRFPMGLPTECTLKAN